MVRTATIDFDSSFISHRFNRFSSIGNETRWAMFMWSSDFLHGFFCLFISLFIAMRSEEKEGKSINAWRFNEPHPHLYSKRCTSSLQYSFSLSLLLLLFNSLSTSFALFRSPFLFIFAWILAHPRISSTYFCYIYRTYTRSPSMARYSSHFEVLYPPMERNSINEKTT